MIHYLVQPKDWIFVKGYGSLSFPKSINKSLGEKINKNVSSKRSQKRLDHAKQSTTDTIKTASKRRFIKHQKQVVIWFVITLLVTLQQKFQNFRLQ